MDAPDNGWHLCFFPWYEQKAYKKKSQFHQKTVPDMTEDEEDVMKRHSLNKGQMYWRRTQIQTMGLDKFKREFPASVAEAFMSNSALFYPTDIVDACEIVSLGNGKDMWYCDPQDGERYAMGVDVAHGTGKDYSAITVVSTTTLQPIYHYRCNTILPATFADKVWDIYWTFNEPYTIVEANGPGSLVIHRLEEFGTKNMYKSDKGKDWHTRKENKLSIYDNLRELLCEGVIRILEEKIWSEIRNTLTNPNGAPHHPKGANDDLLVSFVLALEGARLKPAPSIYGVRVALMDEFIMKTKARRIRQNGPLPFRRRGQ